MIYRDRQTELKRLAFIDESQPYEIDEAGIYIEQETGRFVLLTASGCSCWDGEYDEAIFDSFDALAQSLIDNDLPRYNPSLDGAKKLIAEARATL